MVTKLTGQLRREITIQGRAYIVSLDDEGLRLTVKGRRRGQALRWDDFANGNAALATALNASLAQANDRPRNTGRTRRGPDTSRIVKTPRTKTAAKKLRA